jgi:hypothetical protein
VDREVLLGLVRNTRDREAFRFIPVLREGADIATLPPFVHQHQWVDLHDNGQVAEQIRRLLGILRKSSPSVAAVPPEYWSTHCPFMGISRRPGRIPPDCFSGRVEGPPPEFGLIWVGPSPNWMLS